MESDKSIRENYCFWCSIYGKSNEPFCMGCGNKIGTYPPEVEALIATETQKARKEGMRLESKRHIVAEGMLQQELNEIKNALRVLQELTNKENKGE